MLRIVPVRPPHRAARAHRLPHAGLLLLLALGATHCADSSDAVPDTSRTDPASSGAATEDDPDATRPLTRWDNPRHFFDRPFPCASRMRPGGGVDLDGFPNPRGNRFVADLLGILEQDAAAFARTGAIYLPLSGGLDPDSLPQWTDTLDDASPVRLLPLDESVRPARIPVTVAWESEGGPFGAPNLLSVLPIQGIPMAANTPHAVFVTDALRDPRGATLRPSPELRALVAGAEVPGLEAEALALYRRAVERFAEAGNDPARLVAIAAFTTDDPARGMRQAAALAANLPLPAPGPWETTDLFPSFCVVQTTIDLPVFQQGSPPFNQGGGGWAVDGQGTLLQQGTETARIVVSIPRHPAPEPGWPTLLFVRTGGGGDRPLVDRGRRAIPGGEAILPGSGYAEDLARAGFAGISVDGPHGGLRNITGGDEQFLIFNITNPIAMRDNIRQSALELLLVARMLPTLQVPAAQCPDAAPGGEPIRLDSERLALFGHSMGATIAPLALAFAPEVRAAVFSGAGGSWIANVVHKEQPLRVRPLAELTLGYVNRRLHEHDVALTLLQWAGEPADPPVYAELRRHDSPTPLHVLMLQGIADTYILPPMANALSLAAGLDLAGEILDRDHPVAGRFTSLHALLPVTGGRHLELPAAGNTNGTTALVVQHPEDGVEDGHEIAFQRDEPRLQARCFLETFARGLDPVVVPGGTRDAACP